MAWQASTDRPNPDDYPAASDEEIANQNLIKRSLVLLQGMEKVEVLIRGRSILLFGEVPEVAHIQSIEGVVEKTLPNRYVINQLVITSTNPNRSEASGSDLESQEKSDGDIQQRLETIFKAITSLEDLKVRVSSGVVQLSGEAITLEAAEKAEALATQIQGVVYVENNIAVSQEVNRRIAPLIDNTTNRLRQIWMSLPLLVIALVIVALFFLLGKWAMRWERLYRLVANQPLVKGILQQAIFLGFLLIGVILALDLLNARRLVTTLFGAAGIVGLALGFALKDIAENYLSSLLLAVRRPFIAKDYVKIGSYEGTVVRLNVRDTVLMTSSGNHLRLPNALVFKSVIVNYTRNPLRRFHFDVGIGVGEDLLGVQQLGLATLRETPGIVEDPKVSSIVTTLGDSNVNVAFYAWVDQSKFGYGRVKSEALRRFKEAMDAADVDMPIPAYQIQLQQDSSELDRSKLEKKPQKGRAPVTDIGVEDSLDQQIELDRRSNQETDLLES